MIKKQEAQITIVKEIGRSLEGGIGGDIGKW
jgi:hypothetical protein